MPLFVMTKVRRMPNLEVVMAKLIAELVLIIKLLVVIVAVIIQAFNMNFWTDVTLNSITWSLYINIDPVLNLVRIEAIALK